MKRTLLSLCAMLLLTGNLYAAEIAVPAGTRIEGTTEFGTFAPAETATAQNFFLTIKATRNPLGVNGKEIPLKDCVILGDVIADVTVNRAFFRAIRIVCSNSKEPNGSPLKGHAVDEQDNKLGILGVPVNPAASKAKTAAGATGGTGATSATQRFVETPPAAKVTVITLEGIIINTN
jgi:hypothetical protein